MAHERISYETILAAKRGSPEAMETILAHFDRYINANAFHPQIEGFPESGGGLNQEIKAQIQEKLIYQILFHFDPTKLPEGETLEPSPQPPRAEQSDAAENHTSK